MTNPLQPLLKALFYTAQSGFFRDHPASSGYCNIKCLLTTVAGHFPLQQLFALLANARQQRPYERDLRGCLTAGQFRRPFPAGAERSRLGEALLSLSRKEFVADR